MESFNTTEAAREREVRLLIIATGVLGAAHLPFWLNWLSTNRPKYDVTVAATDSACNFVSVSALAALTGRPVLRNSWEEQGVQKAVHPIIASSYDAIAVFPASLDFMSRLAYASGSSPFHLSLLGASCPIAIAPTYPPQVHGHPHVVEVADRLRSIPNYHLVDGQPGRGRATGEPALVAAPLWTVVATLERALLGEESNAE